MTLEGNLGPIHIKSWLTGTYKISAYEGQKLKENLTVNDQEIHLNLIITHSNGTVQRERIILDSIPDPNYHKYNPEPK